VVAGGFNSDDAKDAKEIDRVLRDYFSTMKKPVVTNFPVGHITRNATLPVGALVELDGDAGSLRLLENPVQLDGDTIKK
jgi:muramoyltetrapeptide carboxypeptidase